VKTYLTCLFLVTSSIWLAIPPLAVAKPKPAEITTVVAPKVIAPAAALNRLIIAEKLEASWFTPDFLKAVDKNSDVNAVQLQRDVTMKLGRFRYGNYKSVQPIGNDKYRVLFDRAEPDAVIVTFKIDASGRIAGVGIAEKNQPAPTAQAQSSAEAAIDRSFKTNTGSDGKPSQIVVNLKQWLGNYQKIQKKDGTSYLGIFDRGSVPINVQFNDNGSVKSYGMNCPTVNKSVSLTQAPPELQKLLSKCPNLK
jgi:hypothetical protein